MMYSIKCYEMGGSGRNGSMGEAKPASPCEGAALRGADESRRGLVREPQKARGGCLTRAREAR